MQTSAAIFNSAHFLATPQTSPAFQGFTSSTQYFKFCFSFSLLAGVRKPSPCIWPSLHCRHTSSSSGLTGPPAPVCLAKATPPPWHSPPPTGSWRTTGSPSSASSPPTSPPTASWTRRSRRRTRGQWSTKGCTGEQNARLGGRGTVSSSMLQPASFDVLQDSCHPLGQPDSSSWTIILFQFSLNLSAKLWQRSTSTIQTELPDQHLTKYISCKVLLLFAIPCYKSA